MIKRGHHPLTRHPKSSAMEEGKQQQKVPTKQKSVVSIVFDDAPKNTDHRVINHISCLWGGRSTRLSDDPLHDGEESDTTSCALFSIFLQENKSPFSCNRLLFQCVVQGVCLSPSSTVRGTRVTRVTEIRSGRRLVEARDRRLIHV